MFKFKSVDRPDHNGTPEDWSQHMWNQVYDLYNGSDPSKRRMYSTYNSSECVWDPEAIVYGLVGVTSIANWNSRGGNTRGGILITPRHMVVCRHYTRFGEGDVVRFTDKSNTSHTRTVLRRLDIMYNLKNVPTNDTSLDITILLLDSDVPVEIVKVLPDDFRRYVPSTRNFNSLYIRLDQDREANLCKLKYYTGDTLNKDVKVYTNYFDFELPVELRQYFYGDLLNEGSDESARGGDSGRSCWFVVNGEIVMAGVNSTTVSSSTQTKSGFDAYIKKIDELEGIDTGYKTTPVDLTGFVRYEAN